MDLSVATSTAYSDRFSSLDNRSGGSLSPSSAAQADERGNAETLSQRPAREPQQASRLTPEEQRQLSELQQRDREVKAHELAHKSAGGQYVTGGSFSYQTGPDGQRYAIGGEVTIDSSSGSTPQETLSKAELIRRAALAPADPSPQDYRVAAEANMMAAQARGEISAERRQAAIQARESRPAQEQAASNEADDRTLPRGAQRAIASFEAVSGATTLRSDPDPIDELV